MPYQTPPTFADGNILSASQLNILSDDIEYLYGLVSGVSFPFTGMSGNGEVDMATVSYYQFHAARYLVHLLTTDENLGSDPDNNAIYYVNWGTPNSMTIVYAGTTGTTQSGSIDLYDPATWPLYAGAWAATTAYDGSASPTWGGSPGDGEIVLEGGAFYKCIQSHTSGTAFGTVGVQWALIGTPNVGQMYRLTWNLNFDAGVANRTYALKYFYETN